VSHSANDEYSPTFIFFKNGGRLSALRLISSSNKFINLVLRGTAKERKKLKENNAEGIKYYNYIRVQLLEKIHCHNHSFKNLNCLA